MSWNDCPPGPTASPDLAFDCTSNASSFTLVCSLVLADSEANIIGAELVVDIQHSAASLPDWWRFDGSGTGGCRSGGLTTSYDFAPTPSCADAWSGNGFGAVQSFTIGPPDHPLASQARIKAVASVTANNAVTLDRDTQYGIVRLILSTTNSTGTGACDGCSGSACLVLNSILLRRLPGQGDDVYQVTPASGSSNWATWQGTGADCAQVPTRRTTWGQIKSLYR